MKNRALIFLIFDSLKESRILFLRFVFIIVFTKYFEIIPVFSNHRMYQFYSENIDNRKTTVESIIPKMHLALLFSKSNIIKQTGKLMILFVLVNYNVYRRYDLFELHRFPRARFTLVLIFFPDFT